MASTFVELDPTKHSTTGVFHNAVPQMIWYQFVPGIVEKVITNTEVGDYGHPSEINWITARPHISDGVESRGVSTRKYMPLLRGVTDVPVKGDSVLLCTFTGHNYYLGPVNTTNNPNWNQDDFYSRLRDRSELGSTERITTRDEIGLSRKFKVTPHHRLEKKFNDDLDDVGNEPNTFPLNDIHGDLMLEGRHGNSIRIGSRSADPYIILSNGRAASNSTENIADSTLISITDKGSLFQHYGGYDDTNGEPVGGFILASDHKDNTEHRIADAFRITNGDPKNPTELMYEHDGPQLLQSSGRITINAKKESLFLSSVLDTHIGAGRSLTLSANKDIIIDSTNIYLGKKAFTSKEPEPLVLGKQLMETLDKLIDAIGLLYVGGTVGGVSVTAAGSNSPGWMKLDKDIRKELKEILSTKHFIEDNEVTGVIA